MALYFFEYGPQIVIVISEPSSLVSSSELTGLYKVTSVVSLVVPMFIKSIIGSPYLMIRVCRDGYCWGNTRPDTDAPPPLARGLRCTCQFDVCVFCCVI